MSWLAYNSITKVCIANKNKRIKWINFQYSVLLLVFFLSTPVALGQKSIDETLSNYNSGSVPYISVDELKSNLSKDQNIILLDARSREEYNVSHLKNAIWVGYKSFEKHRVENLDKNEEIIIYCSVGVRSEQIGEELIALGFTDIKNLYGGIFSWSNKGLPLYTDGKQTDDIHTYNKRWSQFIKKGKKVY
jgi:rhodanese-related sulfurtransferase